MTDQIIIIVAIISFLIIGFLIKKRKIDTIGEFSLNRNNLNWFPIAAGISMTFAGGAALLNMASLGYTFSWFTLVDPIALTGGIITAVLLVNKYRNDKGVTISNLLAGADKKLSILIGFITSVIFILILSAQFVALSKLLSPFFPSIHSLLLLVLLATLIFSYVFVGGFRSVTKTDILQLIFIASFLVLPIIFFILFKQEDLNEDSVSPHSFLKMPLNLIVLLSVSFLFIPLSQDINIRVKSAKTKNQAVKGLLFGALLYSLIVVVSSYIGISLGASGIVLDDPEQAYTVFFKTNYPSFGILAILAALAAIISTMDSYSLNSITSISQDLLFHVGTLKNKSQRQLINIASIIVFIISLTLALFFNEVLTLILTALLIYISTLIPIALGKKLGLTNNSLFISSICLIIGIITIEVLKINLNPKAILYPVFGILIMIVFLFIQKLTSKA